MTRMFRHWDIASGAGATLAVVKLESFNSGIATMVGVLTVILLSLRVRSEWRNRNKPTKDPNEP